MTATHSDSGLPLLCTHKVGVAMRWWLGVEGGGAWGAGGGGGHPVSVCRTVSAQLAEVSAG
jgi:hypothetical protein